MVELFFRRPGELVLGRETADAALDRFTKAINSVMADHAHQDIAIVSHGNFIVALINALTDKLPSEGLYYWHYNTGMTRIDFAANGWMIVRYVNRCDHLPPQWVT